MNIKETNERVDHPAHYNQGGLECIDAMLAAFGREYVLAFCVCNAFKYLWRHREKGKGYEDLEKAKWYQAKAQELMLVTDEDVMEMFRKLKFDIQKCEAIQS